ncbi:MAG TPA: glycoside hydrolase family 3 N-terminal domain-containing protein [Cyclobacteriaceae bacterium]|nr:glycoside hydrolase family 3 N-terminal domain-containing protein [Cyclobacteriaceae bacterium]
MRNISHVLTVLLLVTGIAQAQTTDSLDIKIGQMLLIGIPKAEVDPLVLEEVRAGKAGAIILFEKNIPKGTASFTALKKIIWAYQQAAPTTLLVAIDQEGGKVNRLKDKYGFARSITAQEMGKATNLDSVRFFAESTAATLAGLGFNVNFAPVVDLGVNKDNTVIYKAGRSFSANPDSVTLMAEEFIKPHRRLGVITVLKHFPGHGSSMADTHFGVADVTRTWTSAELIPYQKLIGAHQADAIMSAHIVNKQLDPSGLPGTLSKRILDSLLRKQMNYDGVIFSDDMQMQAIAKQYGLEEAIRLSINAGIDILCFSNNIQDSENRTVNRVHTIIRSMVEKGQISRERIDKSYQRIRKLKARVNHSGEENMWRDLEASRNENAALRRQVEELRQAPVVKSNPPADSTREEPKSKKKKKKKSK